MSLFPSFLGASLDPVCVGIDTLCCGCSTVEHPGSTTSCRARECERCSGFDDGCRMKNRPQHLPRLIGIRYHLLLGPSGEFCRSFLFIISPVHIVSSFTPRHPLYNQPYPSIPLALSPRFRFFGRTFTLRAYRITYDHHTYRRGLLQDAASSTSIVLIILHIQGRYPR